MKSLILLLSFLVSLVAYSQDYPEFTPGKYTIGDTVKVTSKSSLFVAVRNFNASAIPSDNSYWDYAGPVNGLTLEKLDARLKATEARLKIVEDKVNATPIPTDPDPVPSATYNFALTKNTAWKKRAFAGTEDWNGQFYTSFPSGFSDKYFRVVWTDIEKVSQGNYDWTRFDQEIRKAIDAKAKFSFGVFMLNNSDGFLSQEFFNGVSARYPKYVHDRMQAESVKDFVRNNQWVPNWNSTFMLDRYDAMLQALANHINTTSYNGVAYKDVINYVDIRGYGQWGEWHLVGIVNQMTEMPYGTAPTVATYKRFIDGHIKAFPDYPLVMLLAALDPNRLGHTKTPLEVVDYILKARNSWGLIGVRRDQWGATDGYISDYTNNNTSSYNGGPVFSTVIMDRWKYAPWVGEPMGPGSNLSDLENQVRKYRAASIGNGNYTADATSQSYFRAAENAAGYKIALTGGAAKTSTTSDLTIDLNIENFGIAPCYEGFDLVYQLKNSSGTVVWTSTSTWKPLLKLPGFHAANDTFKPVVAPGIYTLVATFKNNYRAMPLFNNGQAADGSIVLSSEVKL